MKGLSHFPSATLAVAAISLVCSPNFAAAKLIDVTEEAIFDISIGGKAAGTIVIALFGRDLPKTVANFATFASSNGFQVQNNNYNYRNSRFHRVIPNFVIQVSITRLFFVLIFSFNLPNSVCREVI